MTRPLALALALAAAGPAAGQPYTFTRVADSASPTYRDLTAPSINAAGAVAFYATRDAGGAGIYRVAGGTTTVIADTSNPAINAAGVVAFQAYRNSTATTTNYTGSGGAATPVGSATGSFALGRPHLNDAGVVVYTGPAPTGQALYANAGGTVTTIAASGPQLALFSFPWVNQAGQVAFGGTTPTNGHGLFIGSGGPLTTVVDPATSPFQNIYPLSFTDGGVVGFAASLPAGGGTRVHTWSGGTLTTVATSATVNGALVTAPAVNEAGAVAFLTNNGGSGGGIFTWKDGVTTPVIKVGDPLGGGTVVHLAFHPFGFNDDGQVAFRALLSGGGGQDAVFVATPVPEPATVGVAAAAGLGLTGWWSRRRRPGSASP